MDARRRMPFYFTGIVGTKIWGQLRREAKFSVIQLKRPLADFPNGIGPNPPFIEQIDAARNIPLADVRWDATLA